LSRLTDGIHSDIFKRSKFKNDVLADLTPVRTS
jgi:hypothetical protein